MDRANIQTHVILFFISLGFLEEFSSVRIHTMGEIPARHNQNPPVLVHCSAGVGRTGVTILSDLLLCALDHNQVTLFHLSDLNTLKKRVLVMSRMSS